jgi:hypothetical protein
LDDGVGREAARRDTEGARARAREGFFRLGLGGGHLDVGGAGDGFDGDPVAVREDGIEGCGEEMVFDENAKFLHG